MKVFLLLLVVGCATTEDGAVTSGDVTDVNPRGVFDVTTVYQLQAEEDTPERTSVYNVGECYVDGNRCHWEKSGWNSSDSNYVSVEFPSEVIHKGITTSSVYPKVMRVTSNKFAISIKPVSSNVEFYIYLMAEEDVDLSDMLVIQIRNNKRDTDAFRCLQTVAAYTPLPTMRNRMCTTIFTDTRKDVQPYNDKTFNSYSVEINEGKVKVVYTKNQQVWFEVDLEEKFRELVGAINYVGIQTDGEFKYSTPVDVLALSRRHGSLASSSVSSYPSQTSLLCVQMSIYIDPKSKGSVAMSLVFNNGTTLKVGEIHTTNDKVEQWRFMSLFHTTKQDSFRVQIEASKANTNALVVTGIRMCNATGEFGNVVFNQPGPAKLYLRTNARGLPLMMPDGTIKSTGDGTPVQECYPTSMGCPWTLNNFTLANVGESQKPLLNIDKVNNFVDWTSATKPMTKLWTYHSPLKFNYEVTGGNPRGTLNIILMDSQQDKQNSDMYVLHLRWNNVGTTYLYRCTSSDYSTAVYMPDGTQRTCTAVASYSFQWYFSTDDEFSFKLETVSGRIVLTVAHSDHDGELVVFNWTDRTPIKITHFALGSNDIEGVLRGNTDYPVFSLSQPTGSMVSPPLPPSVDRVCISLVFYAGEKGASIDLLMQQDNVETPIGTFLSAQSHKTRVWSHRNVIAQVAASSRGETRVVIAARGGGGTAGQLLIQRVAGCNAQDPEEILVLKTQSRITPIDVSHNDFYSEEAVTKCSNGGLKRGFSQFVCRPGFKGYSCSEGCGANSFGSDCGGVCSESVHGCKGLALCKPLLGCDCAPGYKGLLCDTPCSAGEYGAGCRERCGHCDEESCDAYTGVCHQGCRSGHYPPFCQEVYAYIEDAPIVKVDGFHDVTIMTRLNKYKGHGIPHFYQVQYKELVGNVATPESWSLGGTQLYSDKTEILKDFVETNLVGHLTGLKPGSSYLARVVLIDNSFASYQGDLVGSTVFSTPCLVPQEADYLYYQNKNDTSVTRISRVEEERFELEWQVPRGNASWCETIGYEIHVHADWRKEIYNAPSDARRKVIRNLTPGKEYRVIVRGVTKQGVTAFTHAQTVKMLERAPEHVRNLRLTLAAERSLKIGWEEPRRTWGNVRRYVINYQCLHLGACPEAECAGSAGKMEVMSTSAQLDGLLPYALYKISVAGTSSLIGLSSSMQAVTALAAPEVAPSSASPAIVSRTNSSFSVQWAAPESCRHINGYLTGYRYELLSPGQKSPLLVGTTTNTTASFSGLVPHSDFVVRVLATNSAGWGTAHALEILVKTRATTPEVVEELTVYKRGRRMLGLRWSPPRMTYGSLESFTVTHRPLDGSHKTISVTVTPSPCPAWPRLYCHTVKNLKADADYIVAVQARNSEVSVDGEEVAIKATTKEGGPGAPSFLRVVNQTDVDVTIEWGLPDMINGQLRSFLVNVEETDSQDSSDCCQYFPIREVIVTEEKLAYQFQMTGLKAASTYEVGVTAKTVSLGQAVSVTAHTRPRTPILAHAPNLAEPAQIGKSLRVHVEPSVDYQGDIVRGYMLLLKAETTAESSPISDDWLANELNAALNGSFSLAAEFNHMDLPEDGIVTVDPSQPLVDGVFGSVGMTPLVANTRYQLAWVLVLEYRNTLSVGHILGETFTVTEA